MSGPFRLGDIHVDPERNRIATDDTVHRVTAREMQVLVYLAERAGGVVTRPELLDEVWSGVVVNDEALTLVISRLRSALGDDARAPRVIETIPKKGYRMMILPQQVGVGVASPAASRANESGRISWVWAAVFATLFLAMTALFLIVRTEYERVTVEPDTPKEFLQTTP